MALAMGSAAIRCLDRNLSGVEGKEVLDTFFLLAFGWCGYCEKTHLEAVGSLLDSSSQHEGGLGSPWHGSLPHLSRCAGGRVKGRSAG